MSTELVARQAYTLTRFYGGDQRGVCLQLTSDQGYIQVKKGEALQLVTDVIDRFLSDLPATASGAEADNHGVEVFAQAMRAKLAQKRDEGRGGWNDPDCCAPERLATLLLEHLEKGDPVDIGNFAMMLYCRPDARGVLGATFQEWLLNQKTADTLRTALAQADRSRAEGRLEGELKAAREETERARRERDDALAAKARAELNLSRALGYIDRATEDLPPLPGQRTEVHQRVGSVAESYIRGPEPRGPKLDLGEPYNPNGYGLSR